MQKNPQSMWSGQFKSQNILKVALCETTDLYTCSCIRVDNIIIICFGSLICLHEVQYFLKVIQIFQSEIFWSNFILAMELLKDLSNQILSRLQSYKSAFSGPGPVLQRGLLQTQSVLDKLLQVGQHCTDVGLRFFFFF